MENKYKDLRYDRQRYIPKGYILPDGTMISEEYGKYHDDIAERFIMENYYESYMRDTIRDKKDFLLMRLDALQVMLHKMKIVVICEGNHNKVIQEAVASYLSYGWEEQVVPNPYKSHIDLMRSNILMTSGLFFQGDEDDKKVFNPYALRKCRKK